MRGEIVTVKKRIQEGFDELNDPIWKDKEYLVENVLIAPGSSDDAVESTRPDGVEIKYTLYFPKPFDEKLEHCQICVRDEWLDVIGSPRRFDLTNCPTDWWMVVGVGATNG